MRWVCGLAFLVITIAVGCRPGNSTCAAMGSCDGGSSSTLDESVPSDLTAHGFCDGGMLLSSIDQYDLAMCGLGGHTRDCCPCAPGDNYFTCALRPVGGGDGGWLCSWLLMDCRP